MRPQDILKSVITTLFGLFEFLKMPFSLRNAAQNFQRFIDTVTRCFVYVDDFLASVSQKEYMKKVLQRLQAHGIQVNKGSCILAAPSLPFLGQIVDTNGITKSKRRYLPHIAITLAPLCAIASAAALSKITLTHASDHTIGAFFSRRFTAAHKRFSAFGCQLLNRPQATLKEDLNCSAAEILYHLAKRWSLLTTRELSQRSLFRTGRQGYCGYELAGHQFGMLPECAGSSSIVIHLTKSAQTMDHCPGKPTASNVRVSSTLQSRNLRSGLQRRLLYKPDVWQSKDRVCWIHWLLDQAMRRTCPDES
ncbi:Retrovirus-related Pol polyprotein from transposon opus [Trichinella pseudospiralis]|uniref:Retrovirus-related Pol polyprotein from transposon opus n=1 Tax=Trichinella pseudospiralis TaxID=6337 RepID=A0A0V1JGA7_TRIPS|nr:Retrovirus-related Pol polyprotein from transposon opus [Trichinella pseudospiralis]KRZ42727.1 Retrovirus-related Pol polyprotein from transposon opus [Trichinella pseudospiralis]